MAEEQNQTRASIQDEISFQLSPAGKTMRSFDMIDKQGDCTVPENVHIRFYNCEFDSFNSGKGNNNFYFYKCKFKKSSGYTLKDSSAIFDNCIFEGLTIFENTQVSLINNCVVYQGIFASEHSQVISKRTLFQGEVRNGSQPSVGVYLDTKARFNSTLDIFKGWVTSAWKASHGSVMILNAPIVSPMEKSFGVFSDSFVRVNKISGDLQVTGTDASTRLFTLTRSGLNLQNAGKVLSSKTAFEMTDSALLVNNVTELKANQGNVVNAVGSTVYLSDCGVVGATTGPAFLLDSCEFELNGTFTPVSGSNGFISATNSQVNVSSENQTSLIANSGSVLEITGDTQYSTVLVRNVKEMKSGSGAAVSVQGASIELLDVETISGTSPAAILGIDSTVVVRNSKVIEGTGPAVRLTGNVRSSLFMSGIDSVASAQTGIVLSKKSSAILVDVAQIRGDQKGISVGDESACQLLVDGTTNILGNQSDGITFSNGSTVTVKGTALVKGAVTGINGNNAGGGKLYLDRTVKVEGADVGISFVTAEVTVKSNGVATLIKGGNNGIVGSANSEGTSRLNLIGPMQVQGSSQAVSLSNTDLDDDGVTYLGGVSVSSGNWKSKYSSSTKKAALAGVVASLDRFRTQDVLEISQKSALVSRGNVIDRTLNVGQGSSALFASSQATGLGALQAASFLGLRANVEGNQIAATDGFFGLLGGSYSTFRPGGKSTALLGAVTGGSLSFALDSSESPVAALTAGNGDLALQADFSMFLYSLNLTSSIRNNIFLEAQGSLTERAQSNVSIQSVGGNVAINASSEIRLTAAQVFV